jgi:hypothetical protein
LTERLRRAIDEPEPVLEPHEPQRSAVLRRLDSPSSLILGGSVRLLLSLFLFAVLATWLDASGILTFGQLRAQWTEIDHAVQDAMRSSDIRRLRDVKWVLSLDSGRLEEPVVLPWLTALVGDSIRGANLAVAAAVLLISTFSGRRIVGFMALLGAAVALFGAR